jgi:hypothetical protein
MYFPYLRGKQFELIALREIAGMISGSNFINPIIEPVKKKTSTYKSTISLLQKLNINFTIIINPFVGDLKEDIDYVCGNLLPSLSYKNFQIGIIIHSNTDIASISRKLEDLGLSDCPIIIILESVNENYFERLEEFIKSHVVKFILAGSNVRNRRPIMRSLRKVGGNLISLSDPYNKQNRNKDYAFDEDEFFSEEHLYFEEEGFKGYSDLLTVGQEYSDKGYSPYAVAIHLTYSSNDEIFRIHHFVSDSNEDTSDVAGKFAEALEKLIPFIDNNEMYTNACNEFRKLNNEAKYPGLGTVKKLSIFNHIELVFNHFSLR